MNDGKQEPVVAPEKLQKYIQTMHAVQSGVAMMMNYDSSSSPKHLRVGVDSAMVQNAAVVRLMIEKGLITWDEWYDTLIAEAEREVKRYEDLLSEKTGSKVKLA